MVSSMLPLLTLGIPAGDVLVVAVFVVGVIIKIVTLRRPCVSVFLGCHQMATASRFRFEYVVRCIAGGGATEEMA